MICAVMPQETVGDRLRMFREGLKEKLGRKFSQRDFAALLGLKEDTYRAYEYDRAELKEEHARKLASEFGINWKDFYEPVGASMVNEVSAPYAVAPKLRVRIPYVGYVGANEQVNWVEPLESEDFEDVPPEMADDRAPSRRFACRVWGDSCYDLLWPDDLCVFHKHPVPQIGLMVLFRSFDNRVTVKQLKHDGTDFYLHPLNEKYQDCPAEGDVIGYLVGIVRQQGSRHVTVYDATGIRP